MKKFLLPKGAKSDVVNGHKFTNGELLTSDHDGKRLERTLVRFFGCSVVDVPDAEDGSETKDDPSLSVDNTKGTGGGSSEEDEDA